MENNTTTGGISFTGLLQLLFIALKLMGVITWKWFWVLTPLWISIVFSVILIILYVLVIKRDRNKRGNIKWN